MVVYRKPDAALRCMSLAQEGLTAFSRALNWNSLLCTFAKQEKTCTGKRIMSNNVLLFPEQISNAFSDENHTDICVLNSSSRIFSFILV